METSFKYRYINNQNSRLLIYFDDMKCCGYDDKFSMYKKLPCVFHDYDILYLKDTHVGNWYLPIMNEMSIFINKLSASYKFVFGIADSSGTIPLLNILPTLINFHKAVCINGQCSLEYDVISQWRHCTDCHQYSELSQFFDEKHKYPLRNLPSNPPNNYEITMYYNYNGSDAVYHDYVKAINIPNIILKRSDLQLYHHQYIEYFLSSHDNLENIRNYFMIDISQQ